MPCFKAWAATCAPLADDERWLIVHTHLVVVLPKAPLDPDGEITADDFRRVIQSVWVANWQTNTKRLWAEQSVRKALTKLYGYCHKRRFEYSSGGVGDVKVKYHSSMRSHGVNFSPSCTAVSMLLFDPNGKLL